MITVLTALAFIAGLAFISVVMIGAIKWLKDRSDKRYYRKDDE